MDITVENICAACESVKKPCSEPCAVWYECLERGKISEGELLKCQQS